jgi:cytochrome c peroxidase
MVSATRATTAERREIELSDERRGYVLFFDPSPTGRRNASLPSGTVVHRSQLPEQWADSVFADLGRGDITHDGRDDGKFKTPTLRNLAFTAPYMHDGRFDTLEEVLDHYNTGGHGTTNVNPFILNLRRNFALGNGLSDAEKNDLLAFLLTLTDSSYVTNPNLASPY